MNAVTPEKRQLSETEKVASAIAKSGFWGDVNPHAVLMLCYLAEAEGHHPAVVYRDYHIMQGRPAKKAEAILRDFVEAGGKIKWHQLDDTCADATFSHAAGEARISWTTERAKQAGLKSPMWAKYPRQMLRSRCISEGVRTVFPGATSGLYEENEVADIVADQGAVPETSDLKQQLEQSVEEAKQDYAFPEGPARNITDLKGQVRSLWREVKGCGDEDELETLLAVEDNKALIQQCENLENPAHRQIWEGDGEDNPGLHGVIQQQRAQLKAEYLNAG